MALEFYVNRAVNEKLRANGLGTPTTFHRTRMRADEVISALSAQSGLTTGQVQGIFTGLAELVAREIANGSVVTLPELGTIREDVKGVIEPNSPNSRGQTETKTHVRTTPSLKARITRYLTVVQVPKVIPAPDIQSVDTSFKLSFVAPVGTMWGPAQMPSDNKIIIPESAMVQIKGKNLIWDVSKNDEGLFYKPDFGTGVFVKVPDTQIIGRRGRSLTVNGGNLVIQSQAGGLFEVRSRLGTRDLRVSSYAVRFVSGEAVGS